MSRFPIDSDAQESSGLPWGVTVTPFAATDEEDRSPAYGTDGHVLPRCENCWAYFNTYCDLDQWSWTCCLCSQLNGFDAKAIARYSHPESCPEMKSSFVDLELPGDCYSRILFVFSVWQPRKRKRKLMNQQSFLENLFI